MRVLLALVRKEFLQIFRDPATVLQIFLIPVIQLIVLSNAATFEVVRSRMLVVDEDQTATSAALAARFDGNDRFRVTRIVPTVRPVEEAFRRTEATLALVIPDGFEDDLEHGRQAHVQMQVNAEEGASAGIVQASAQTVLADFSRSRIAAQARPQAGRVGGLDLRARAWYNPTGNYKHYMVPGLLVSLTTIIGLLLTAQNITREKELGTLDQLNVTPVRRWQVIASKLLPFWFLALLIFSIGLAIGRFLFGIPIEGSLVIVYVAAVGYLLVALGLGLLLSTVTDTQQQTMFVAFFILMIFLLMSGLFTPIDGMPPWARMIAEANPVKHFVVVMRGVLMRGAGWAEVGPTVGGLYLAGLAVCALAVGMYRKESS